MKKIIKILTIIISITLIIQLGTISLNVNQVQADVGNFKSYKSKGSNSSSSKSSSKSHFKSNSSSKSSSKKYKNNSLPKKYYPTPSYNNYYNKTNDVTENNVQKYPENNENISKSENTENIDYLYPLAMLISPLITGRWNGNGLSKGILLIIVIFAIIYYFKGKNK
nr:hypothetical protein [Clostridiales bacterium]